MSDLPERFIQRMKRLLKEEWGAFQKETENVRQYGLRVNTLKISTEEFERIAPFHLTRIPWIDNGYYYEKEDEPARHPYYAAGLYYLQEPSAMTPASRLKIHPGERVLDLCAAPGGKATALAAGLMGKGLIVANDINTARTRALLRNMELFGVSNSLITNESPHILAQRFPEYFDKIMVDAPCSGEGMFRKNPAVMESWKEKGPEYFSALQQEIIVHAADMLKPGGQLFYSTCTFAPEENEGTITHLLRMRPEMEIIPMEDYEGFSEGILFFEGQEFHEDCRLCRRIWPHHMPGEGHFLALLQKRPEERQSGWHNPEQHSDIHGCKIHQNDQWGKRRQKNQEQGKITRKRKKGEQGNKEKSAGKVLKDREQRAVLEEFFSHLHRPEWRQNLDIRGDKVYYVPNSFPKDLRLHFLRSGIYLGDLKKKRFEPSQPFALVLSGRDYDQTINLPSEDERLGRYLHGESIMVEDILEACRKEGKTTENGWYLLLADGYPLGWGKLAGSTLKNKYPAGWRKNQ